VRLVGFGWRALQLMRESVMRRRVVHGGGPVADDRELLLRLLDHLEATPRTTSWLARLRCSWEIRKAHGMLGWEAARHEGPACLNQTRNALALGWSLMWVGSTASALVFRDHPLSISRLAIYLGFSAILFGVGGWCTFHLLPRRMWRDNERQYALYLDRARALPAAPGRPGPRVAA